MKLQNHSFFRKGLFYGGAMTSIFLTQAFQKVQVPYVMQMLEIQQQFLAETDLLIIVPVNLLLSN